MHVRLVLKSLGCFFFVLWLWSVSCLCIFSNTQQMYRSLKALIMSLKKWRADICHLIWGFDWLNYGILPVSAVLLSFFPNFMFPFTTMKPPLWSSPGPTSASLPYSKERSCLPVPKYLQAFNDGYWLSYGEMKSLWFKVSVGLQVFKPRCSPNARKSFSAWPILLIC